MNRREYLVAAGTYATSLMLGGMAHAKLTAPLVRTGPQPPLQWVTPEVKGRGLSLHTFRSRAVGAEVSFHLYEPPVYGADLTRRFPVVYWLHGSGGGQNGIALLADRADQAIAAGKVPPHLMVFVNGLRMGMYVDWSNGRAPVETVIVHELRPHIDANWRTVATRDGRLLDGFSMGGYGAARLGFRHPELFRTISIMGAGPMQEFLDRTPRASRVQAADLLNEVYGGTQDRFRAASPRRYAEQNATVLARSSRIRLAIGDQDETFVNNSEFHEHLVRLAIPHDWIVLPGVGHNPIAVLNALGDRHWDFYRNAFDAIGG